MIKTLFYLSLFSSLFIGRIGIILAESDKHNASQLVEELLSIENKRLKYKGKYVPVPYTRKRLIEVFGKPSREIYNTAGTVVIWDELGLTCYGCHKQKEIPEDFQYMTDDEIKQSTRRDYVESITIFVRRYNPYPERENKYSHEPQSPFPGKILLDGVELDGVVLFNEFLEQRKGKQTILLPENSFSFFIRCKPQPHEITLHTIRDKYDDDFMSVYSVSIRNIGQYYKSYKCLEIFEAPQPIKPEPAFDEISDEDLAEQDDED
ncbi:hypothetical protein MNBD_GAMMA21-2274 [hydrothermal vent metagenome]|uniref:DUF7738 domain-containing protein n=1 Tax=hydrothermal vent metagenome TaxID=652676 RepID=A0A3B0ZC32_9ZZZZ